MTDDKPKRDERGRLLPGQRSINPKGRPPALPKEVKKILDNLAEEAVHVVHRTLRSDDEKLAFAAAQEILNRAFGKPVAQVDMKVDSSSVSHLAALKAHLAEHLLSDDAGSQEQPKIIDLTPEVVKDA